MAKENQVELTHLIRSMTRFIYVVTEEEDRILRTLRDHLKQPEESRLERVWVFNPALGMKKINDLIKDWEHREHKVGTPETIHDALIQIYKDNPRESENFYIITDPERYLTDAHVQRRLLNIAHQLHADIHVIKVVIFVGQRAVIPDKLARYMHVVHDKGLSSEEILNLVTGACESLRTKPPENSAELFSGLTSFEITSSIAQSIIATKKDPKHPKSIQPRLIMQYKRNQLLKTNLVQYIDTSEVSFEHVGGAQRFKDWARKTHKTWTQAGRDFGLHPPRGVLLVGVHGCGKSLSVKALANSWGLPVIALEMGRLRSSGVGDSENNLYRALRMVEAVSPCILWIDEAEKSLAGGQSSAQSDAGTTSRTLGILSTWVQETKSHVTIVMTANSLKTMPVEMVNRMDERYFFDIPDEEDRIDILKIHLRQVGQNPSNFKDLAKLSEAAALMVGREIEQAIGSAMVESFDQGKPSLDEEILLQELLRKPRIVRTMTDEIQEILKWVGYDEKVDDGIRARFASARRGDSLKLLTSG